MSSYAHTLVPIDHVRPNHRNARTHSKKQIQQNADHGGLARAIESQEAEDFTFLDFESQIVQGRQAAEALGNSLN